MFGCIEALVDFGIVIFLCSLSSSRLDFDEHEDDTAWFNVMSLNVCLSVVTKIVSEDAGSEGGIL